MATRRLRSLALSLLTALGATALALGVGDLVLRGSGYAPRPVRIPGPETPVVLEPDPQLGWRQRPGRYLHPPPTRAGSPFRITIRTDGSRAAGGRRVPSEAPSVWAVGGSFTQGWGVSDEETFVARLQELHPEVRMVNLGVPAYGTVQSWRVVEARLAEEPPPRVVLYGFIADHARRNVGTSEWIRNLSIATERRPAMVRFPICHLGPKGRLRCTRSRPFATFPLGDRLASVHLLETSYGQIRTRGRGPQRARVTEAVLGELAQTVRRSGARLLVALLHGPPPELASYSVFLRERGVRVADCALSLVPGLRLPGDVHPSARAHARYARCIAPELRALLEDAPTRKADTDGS